MKKPAVISGSFDLRVDTYIAQSPPFAQPLLTHLRELVHKASPEVEESIKWSRPFFMHHRVVLANMAAFKAHCSFGFWGPEMAAVLRADGIETTGSSGSFGRLTGLQDLPSSEVLLGYIKQAVVLAESSKGSKLSSGERTKKH